MLFRIRVLRRCGWQVDRYTKTKKSIYTGFELFSLKERDIPMEVLELPNKSEKIIDFAWEPKVSSLWDCCSTDMSPHCTSVKRRSWSAWLHGMPGVDMVLH